MRPPADGRGRETRADRLELTLLCRHCGRPIVLVVGPFGVELPDRAGFLRVHSDCLRRGDMQ